MELMKWDLHGHDLFVFCLTFVVDRCTYIAIWVYFFKITQQWSNWNHWSMKEAHILWASLIYKKKNWIIQLDKKVEQLTCINIKITLDSSIISLWWWFSIWITNLINLPTSLFIFSIYLRLLITNDCSNFLHSLQSNQILEPKIVCNLFNSYNWIFACI